MKTYFKLPLMLRVALPSILGLCLLWVLTDIMYSGGARVSLAGIAETQLLQYALEGSAYPAAEDPGVAVISLNDQDLPHVTRASSDVLNDADMTVYAEVLKNVAAQNPRLILINWLAGAHSNPTQQLQVLSETIDKLPNRKNIIIGYPLSKIGLIDKGFAETYQMREGHDCYYEVTSYCAFNKEWTWMIQAIVDRLWDPIPRFAISYNLPHYLQMFVAYLPDYRTLPTYSFTDVLKRPNELGLSGKVVTIGNNTTQRSEFWNNKEILLRTYVAGQDKHDNLMQDGIPFHVFWAQLAEMFLENKTINVSPPLVDYLLMILVSCVVLFALVKVGPAASFGTFLMILVIYPFFNRFAIRHLQFYLPLVDIVYSGLVSFVSAAFVQISFKSYQQWRLEAREATSQSTADLKSNFISLISHNLNTPVAKLRGLVDVLLTQKEFPPEGISTLESCNRMIIRMFLIVRSVLYTNTVEQGNTALQATDARKLLQEFRDTYMSSLTKMGIKIDFAMLESLLAGQAEQQFFVADLRLASHAIAAMLCLFEKCDPTESSLDISVQDNEIIRLVVQQRMRDPIPDLIHKANFHRSRSGKGETCGEGFYFDALLNFIVAFAQTFQGSFECSMDPNNSVFLALEFNSSSPS